MKIHWAEVYSPWDEKWMAGANPSVWMTLLWQHEDFGYGDFGYGDPSFWFDVEGT